MAANFDRIARAYRWLEYLSFGPLLQRCRLYRLGEIKGCSRALILGDGDGRFLRRLMEQNRELRAEAVDASPAMLALLERRVASHDRLCTSCQDIRNYESSDTYDLVTTHFFLDCLTSDETAQLVIRIRPHVLPGARWVVSDFAIPEGLAAIPSRMIVSALYAAFGILTGLKIRRLPLHREALDEAGFRLIDRKEWLGGMLFSELWRLEATEAEPAVSH